MRGNGLFVSSGRGKTQVSRAANKAIRRGARGVLATLVFVIVAAAFHASSANAIKIANPSDVPGGKDFVAAITGGYVQINGTGGLRNTFSLNFGPLVDGQPDPRPKLRGTISSNGDLYIPKSQVTFPAITFPVDATHNINVTFVATHDWVGSIDPLTGKVNLTAKLMIQLSGDAGIAVLDPATCRIGTTANPVTITAQTHIGDNLRQVTYLPDLSKGPPTTEDPTNYLFPGGALSGEAYTDEIGRWATAPEPLPLVDPRPAGWAPRFTDRPAGSFRAVDDTLSVPASSGCLGGAADGTINGLLGLPAAAPNQRASFDIAFVPGAGREGANAIVQKGVKSNFTAPGLSTTTWPSTETPQLPTQVPLSIDASTSAFTGTPNAAGRYRFDLGDGNGYGPWTNTATASKPEGFTTTGTRTIRVQARDADGDIDTKTRTIEVVPSSDISVTKTSDTTTFRAGSNGSYTIDVHNNSTILANSQPVTVSDTLPAGTTLVSATGPGWTCTTASTSFSCTRPTGTIPASASAPIALVVAVGLSAPNVISNTATVSQFGDPNPANDTSTATTTIRRTDLRIQSTHAPTVFPANGISAYTLDVDNVGAGETVGTTTVVTNLPTGMTYVAAGSGGTGWSCAATSGNTVTCTASGSIAGNAAASPITVRVKVAKTLVGTYTTTSTVTTADDANLANNEANDSTTVARVPDLGLSVAHSPSTFVVGGAAGYTLRVVNESLLDVTGLSTVSAELPEGITLAGTPTGAGWDCGTSAGRSVVCTTSATVEAEDVAPEIAVSVHVGHAAYGSATTTATVENANDGYAGNDDASDTVTVTRVDVSIAKRVDQSNFSVGVPGKYKIVVKNEGDADTVGPVKVVDDLPSTLSLEDAGGAGWSCATPPVDAPRHIECVRNATLAAGATAPELVITVTVSDAAAEDGTVSNTATVATDRDNAAVAADEPVSGNNSSTYTIAAISVDVAVTEVAHGAPFRVGATGSAYSVKVANVGAIPTVAGEPVTVTIDLPVGVTPGTVVPDRAGWACADAVVTGAHRVTCAINPGPGVSAMPAKTATSTASFAIPVTVDDSAPANGDTVATISTLKDANPEKSPNNVRHDAITAINRIDLKLEANEARAPFAGHTGRYVADVTNVGTAATVGSSKVVLSLPSGTAFVPSKSGGTGWNCSASTSSDVSCTRSASLAAGAAAPSIAVEYSVVARPAAESWSQLVSAQTTGEPATRLANNAATVASTLQVVDFALTKSHTATDVHAGKNGTARLVVKNVGNAASGKPVTVADALDTTKLEALSASGDGWRCDAPAGNALSCTYLGSAAGGETLPAIVTVFKARGDATDEQFDSSPLARVTSTDDVRPENDEAADPTKVIVAADVSVTRQSDGSASVALRGGRPSTDQYQVRNVGALEATDVTADVAYTSGVELRTPLSANADWTCVPVAADTDPHPVADHPVHVRCELVDGLEADDASTLALRVAPRASAAGTAQSAVVTVGAAGDSNPDNDTFTRDFAVTAPDLSVSTFAVEAYTATDPADALLSGKPAVYSAKIENVGSEITNGSIRATFDLPAGAGFTDAPATTNYGADWSCTLSGAKVSCVYGGAALAAGASTTVRIPLTPVAANAPEITPVITVKTDDDANAGNDSRTVTDKVVTPPVVTTPEEPTTTTTTTTPPVAGSTAISGKLTAGSITLGTLPALGLTANQLTVSGTISSAGAMVLPKDKIKFSSISVDAGSVVPGATAKIILSAAGDGSGQLPPAGGAASVKVPVIAKVEVYAASGAPLLNLGASSNCTVGPIDFDLSGTYDAGSKLGKFASSTVSVPAAGSGCGAIGGTLSSAIGIPSSTNAVSLDIVFSGSAAVDDPPVTPDPTPSATAKEATVKLSTKAATVSKKSTVAVQVACSSTQSIDSCSAGKVTLKAKVKTKKKGKKTVTVTKTVTVGSASYAKLTPGKSATVTVKLNATGKKLAKPGKSAKVSTVVQSSAKGAKAVTGTLTVKFPKAAKKAAKK
jgi:uncharacterized repeat protein (TIGR01451 family)